MIAEFFGKGAAMAFGWAARGAQALGELVDPRALTGRQGGEYGRLRRARAIGSTTVLDIGWPYIDLERAGFRHLDLHRRGYSRDIHRNHPFRCLRHWRH